MNGIYEETYYMLDAEDADDVKVRTRRRTIGIFNSTRGNRSRLFSLTWLGLGYCEVFRLEKRHFLWLGEALDVHQEVASGTDGPCFP